MMKNLKCYVMYLVCVFAQSVIVRWSFPNYDDWRSAVIYALTIFSSAFAALWAYSVGKEG